MDSMQSLLANGLAGFLLLFSASSSFANTCVSIPLKPVQHICGIVMNQAGERISNARLTLIKGEVELLTIETDADGRFDFIRSGGRRLCTSRLDARLYPSPVSNQGCETHGEMQASSGRRALCNLVRWRYWPTQTITRQPGFSALPRAALQRTTEPVEDGSQSPVGPMAAAARLLIH
jgi:hypothetical protein